ncbi:hypothetical protein, partial [Catellatospora methionotrophica]|uniref:hypothetical protein n=1 Tax=Catellatospora methionotrophica TaxID=121620 RepID=UPI0033E1678D
MLSIGVSAVIAAATAPLAASPAAAAGPQIIGLGLLPGMTDSVATDLNEHGVVVGNSSAGQVSRGFRWKNGVLTDLGSLGGQRVNVTGINNNGWITGTSTLADNVSSRAFLWRPGQPMIAIGPAESYADDINDAGVVVGHGFDPGFGRRGFRWENGVTTVVEDVTGGSDLDWRRFVPVQVNGSGVIAGDCRDLAARWVNGVVVLAGVAGAWSGGVNAAGDVTVTEYAPTERAYVWKADGSTRPLQVPAGADRVWPTGINADGDAVGSANTGNNNISRRDRQGPRGRPGVHPCPQDRGVHVGRLRGGR